MSHKILIVDDEPANLRLLERLFRRDYDIIVAASGMEAMRMLEQHDVALIITDQRMPGMTGIELLKRTASIRPHTVRIILTGYTDVEALVEAINCGQVYKYVTKPWDNDELRLTVGRAMEHYETNKSRHELTLANERLVSKMKMMTRGFVRAVADALEAKDVYIHGHARRVSGYSAALGLRLGLDEASLEQLSLAAFLHDIGKIGTPESVLLKPGPLTDEERAVMRLHAKRGARMLTGMVDMDEVAEAVLHHHEHFDGTGYPNLLRGEQIPLLSRIILVADAYDAMTSPRPFREACSHEKALEQLLRGAGTQFDPEVVRAFSELRALARIRQSIADGTIGVRLSPLTRLAGVGGLSFPELVFEIETEPALAALALREANLAQEESPTTVLHAACARLGEDCLRKLSERMDRPAGPAHENERLWEHSLRTAEAARLLADGTSIMSADEAYTLGLLHDVGEILLTELFPSEMGRIAGCPMERIEQEAALFGVDHAQVGQWLLDACGLPRHLTAAVQTHHDVARINSPTALLLHVADTIANATSPYEVAALETIDADRIYMLGINRNDLFRIYACVGSAVERTLDPAF
jgi:response regulator RpfG family c-di-GMP phosphodiesterase